jgi:hypothetical protein
MISTLIRMLTRVVLASLVCEARADDVVLDAKSHHLGVKGRPEWREFVGKSPEGDSLEIRFDGRANTGEATLLIRQRDVKLDWPVRINDKVVGKLENNEVALWSTLKVPPTTLRDGANRLTIGPQPGGDDVVIDQIRLDSRPLREAIGGSTLDVHVLDSETGKPLPSRLTITDADGVLAPLSVDPDASLARRPGVVYTPAGRARVSLRPGRYIVYATRGFEYGVDRVEVAVSERDVAPLHLKIRREVATPGLVACDTHIHTVTHSGHGDATIDERVLTLAGEGIELPIATDHEHLTDLGPPAERMGVREWFTPVIGDEVTTRAGHFNAFPLPPTRKVPDNSITDWPLLLKEIRGSEPATIVILNHPRGLHAAYRPFDSDHFNALTGDYDRCASLGVDAMEVVNSGAMQSDPWLLFRDWMALWNHGERITAVAGSDSHDVSRFIVGQGRTYIACPDVDPARLDVEVARKNLRAGKASISLGLLTRIAVNELFTSGDLATSLSDRIRITVSVFGPSWVDADRVELYANGLKVQEQRIGPANGRSEKAKVSWELGRPKYDLSLVAIASGLGVTQPYWPIPRPYQPSSLDWKPVVIGATNPVLIDGDGDGIWSSPWAYAADAIKRVGTDPAALAPALAPFGQATAVQAASLCTQAGRDVRSASFKKALASAPEHVQRGFSAFAATLPNTKPPDSTK